MSDKRSPEQILIDRIELDIQNRSGLGEMWDGIDDETRAEIKSSWMKMVRSVYGVQS